MAKTTKVPAKQPSIYEGLKVTSKKKTIPVKQKKSEVTFVFTNGAFLEIKADPSKQFLMELMCDGRNVYRATVPGGGYIQSTVKFYLPYRARIVDLQTYGKIFDEVADFKGKKVFIRMDSEALGDNLAWMPYFEIFRKKHECELIVSTYYNDLFRDVYPEIDFLAPGGSFTGIYARYDIGWFYKEGADDIDLNRNPIDPKIQPMQKTACDILGLDYEEVKPKVWFKPKARPVISKKYVCIVNHSTLQAKYWNNRVGWQKVVDYLTKLGYVCIGISKEKDGHNGNWNPKGMIAPKDYELSTIMNYIHHADFVLSIPTGLSWLSWALNAPTVLISGFSDPYTEMHQNIIRVSGKAEQGICTGCFNRIRLQHDASWVWCPFQGDDDKRRFECTKTITGEDVIKAMQPYMKKK